MKAAEIRSSTEARPAVQRDLSRLRQAAGQVVGSVFYGTLLKTMRESGLKGTVGHGGRGEEVFAGQLHGLLAERLGTAGGRGVGEAIYRHLEGQQRRMTATQEEARS
ncbi:MAG: hypothetical protein HY763_03100 [Planctomycetes bacterium]|nr:hypothetical protein [Planctomycetota bacterium]